MRASECRCEFNCDTHTIAHAHRHQRRGHGYSGFSFIQTDRFDCLKRGNICSCHGLLLMQARYQPWRA